MLPKMLERICSLCDKIFTQDFLETLQCICPDCRIDEHTPETIDEHIQEEMKNPEFKEAFEKEKERLEKESEVKDGNNRDNGEPGKSL